MTRFESGAFTTRSARRDRAGPASPRRSSGRDGTWSVRCASASPPVKPPRPCFSATRRDYWQARRSCRESLPSSKPLSGRSSIGGPPGTRYRLLTDHCWGLLSYARTALAIASAPPATPVVGSLGELPAAAAMRDQELRRAKFAIAECEQPCLSARCATCRWRNDPIPARRRRELEARK